MNFLEVNNIDSKIIRKLVGKVVCKFYVLTKLIGEGSFGTVYEAVHLSTKELAAVKVHILLFLL
jgi:serine/threonine protein kinase